MLLKLLELLPLIAVIALGAIVGVLLIYYFALYARIAFRKSVPVAKVANLPSLSIVITAKDEAHNLVKIIPVLLDQDYPEFEIVVVNDNSRDETADILDDYKNRYSNVREVMLTSSVSNLQGKRFPMSLGIQAAKYPIVLFTDASCLPSSPQWLRCVAQQFIGNTEVVMGHVTYEVKNLAFNKFLRYDALLSTLRNFSYTLSGMPIMANGRNLAYARTLFFENQKRFIARFRLPFGEDDIFINEVAKKGTFRIADHPDAAIQQQHVSLSQWMRRKRFQVISRKYYKWHQRTLLKNYNLLSILFYLIAICAVLFNLHNTLFLSISAGLIFLKIVSQYLVEGKAAVKYNTREIIPFILWYDLCFAFLNPLIGLSAKFEKWK